MVFKMEDMMKLPSAGSGHSLPIGQTILSCAGAMGSMDSTVFNAGLEKAGGLLWVIFSLLH